MKKQFLNISKLVIAVFFMSITLQSCSSDKSDDEQVQIIDDIPADVELTALINGERFNANQVAGYGTIESNIFNVVAKRGNVDGIVFQIVGPLNVGTHIVRDDLSNLVTMMYSVQNPDTSYVALSNGSITISSITPVNNSITNFKGTFSFIADYNSNPANSNVYQVTEGSFDFDAQYY